MACYWIEIASVKHACFNQSNRVDILIAGLYSLDIYHHIEFVLNSYWIRLDYRYPVWPWREVVHLLLSDFRWLKILDRENVILVKFSIKDTRHAILGRLVYPHHLFTMVIVRSSETYWMRFDGDGPPLYQNSRLVGPEHLLMILLYSESHRVLVQSLNLLVPFSKASKTIWKRNPPYLFSSFQ